MSDLCAIKGKGKRKKERKSLRGEKAERGDLLAACWISFFPLEKIFHFSDCRCCCRCLSSEDRYGTRCGRREETSFPLLSVSAPTYWLRALVEPDAPRRYSSCRLSNSMRDLPRFFFSFFSRVAVDGRSRGLSDDALLPHLPRQTRETTRENLSKLDGGRTSEDPAWNQRDSPFQIRNSFWYQIARRKYRGALNFRYLNL